MTTDTDAHLLAAIHTGPNGEPALETIIARHGAMVLATCRRITRHHHDAEEAAQAVMLVLHDKAKKGLVVACLPAWLHRVACFVAIRLRDARRRRTGHEVGWSSANEVVATTDDTANDEVAQRIDEALDRLPTHYRLPLILHYMESCTFDEIGRRLALRAETVAMRVSRARGMMRRHLAVPERVLDLGCLAGLQTASMPAWTGMRPPTPDVTTLARHYLRRQTIGSTIKVLTAAAAAVLAGCLILACASAAPRDATIAPVVAAPVAAHHAADPASPPPAGMPAPVADHPRAEFPGPLWQEQLVAELSRPVTLYSPGQSVWTLIDSIGQQTGVVMLANGDLHGFQATIPPLIADGESLQAVLDRIAAASGLDFRMYAGGLLWQAAGPPRPRMVVVPGINPVAPIVQRMYHLGDLPKGRSIEDWIQIMVAVPDLHWDSDGYGCEQFDDMLVLTHRADSENAFDAVLRPAAAPELGLPASAPAPVADDVVPTAEQDLFRAMDHPCAPLPDGTARLDALILALAHGAGIDVHLLGDLPAFGLPLPERPLPLHLEGLPFRFALCQVLEGTGLQAAFQLEGVGAAQRPLLVVGFPVAPQFARHRYQWRTQPPMGSTNVGFDSTVAVDWFRVNIDAPSWDDDHAKVETKGETGSIQVTQTFTVLRDLDEQLPRLWSFWNGYHLSPRVPLMPRLLIPATRE